jgi:RNA polymerase sigma-70 factor (ECF subfamily)
MPPARRPARVLVRQRLSTERRNPRVAHYLETVLEAESRSLHTPDRRLDPHGARDHPRRYQLLADEDLISLVVGGDARAFAPLYDRHSRAAYSLAYRLTNGRQAAEDLLQESFIKAWRSAGGYRAGRGSVRTWILSIVRNRAVDHFRSQATRQRTREKIQTSAPVSGPNEAFAEAWRNFERGLLRRSLEALPHEQREVLALNHLSGLTHAEIAERLRLPLGTVKGRMRLGLEKLRKNSELREMALG